MRATAILALLALLGACGNDAETGSSAGVPAADTTGGTARPAGAAGSDLGIPNERHVGDTLVTGGMPDDAALERAAAAGVTTVVSLRQPSEPGFEEERAKVEALGMRFVSIPIAGADGLTEENARAVDEAISSSDGSVLLHCGTGNRAGALVALRAFYVDGVGVEEAIERGRAAGLAGLEDAVRAHLTGYCESHADAAQCAGAT